MSQLYIYAGIAASCVMICIGIGAVVVGFDGRSDVRDELARESIGFLVLTLRLPWRREHEAPSAGEASRNV